VPRCGPQCPRSPESTFATGCEETPSDCSVSLRIGTFQSKTEGSAFDRRRLAECVDCFHDRDVCARWQLTEHRTDIDAALAVHDCRLSQCLLGDGSTTDTNDLENVVVDVRRVIA
jgi:hypothetical protein